MGLVDSTRMALGMGYVRTDVWKCNERDISCVLMRVYLTRQSVDRKRVDHLSELAWLSLAKALRL